MKLSHLLLAIFIALIWGVNFVAAKVALDEFSTFFLMGIRLMVVSIILSPFIIKKPKIPLLKVFKISVTLSVFHFCLMFEALQNGLDVSVAVVMDQLRVPFAAALGYFLLNEKIDKQGIFGMVIAILGTFVIAGSPNVFNNFFAFWLMMGACMAWGAYNIQVKNISQINVLSLIGWVSLFGFPQLLTLSFFTESNQIESVQNASGIAIAAFFYITICATIIAHGSWYYLLRIYQINQVVPYSLLVPVFGLAAGIILLNEVLTWEIIIGGFFTILGVAIILYKKPRSAKGGDSL